MRRRGGFPTRPLPVYCQIKNVNKTNLLPNQAESPIRPRNLESFFETRDRRERERERERERKRGTSGHSEPEDSVGSSYSSKNPRTDNNISIGNTERMAGGRNAKAKGAKGKFPNVLFIHICEFAIL
jgi:hypothetical protein